MELRQKSEMLEVLDRIKYPNYAFTILEENGRLFLQGYSYAYDATTGNTLKTRGDMWVIWQGITTLQFVRMVFAYVKRQEELTIYDKFKFDGSPCFAFEKAQCL